MIGRFSMIWHCLLYLVLVVQLCWSEEQTVKVSHSTEHSQTHHEQTSINADTKTKGPFSIGGSASLNVGGALGAVAGAVGAAAGASLNAGISLNGGLSVNAGLNANANAGTTTTTPAAPPVYFNPWEIPNYRPEEDSTGLQENNAEIKALLAPVPLGGGDSSSTAAAATAVAQTHSQTASPSSTSPSPATTGGSVNSASSTGVNPYDQQFWGCCRICDDSNRDPATALQALFGAKPSTSTTTAAAGSSTQTAQTTQPTTTSITTPAPVAETVQEIENDDSVYDSDGNYILPSERAREKQEQIRALQATKPVAPSSQLTEQRVANRERFGPDLSPRQMANDYMTPWLLARAKLYMPNKKLCCPICNWPPTQEVVSSSTGGSAAAPTGGTGGTGGTGQALPQLTDSDQLAADYYVQQAQAAQGAEGPSQSAQYASEVAGFPQSHFSEVKGSLDFENSAHPIPYPLPTSAGSVGAAPRRRLLSHLLSKQHTVTTKHTRTLSPSPTPLPSSFTLYPDIPSNPSPSESRFHSHIPPDVAAAAAAGLVLPLTSSLSLPLTPEGQRENFLTEQLHQYDMRQQILSQGRVELHVQQRQATDRLLQPFLPFVAPEKGSPRDIAAHPLKSGSGDRDDILVETHSRQQHTHARNEQTQQTQRLALSDSQREAQRASQGQGQGAGLAVGVGTAGDDPLTILQQKLDPFDKAVQPPAPPASSTAPYTGTGPGPFWRIDPFITQKMPWNGVTMELIDNRFSSSSAGFSSSAAAGQLASSSAGFYDSLLKLNVGGSLDIGGSINIGGSLNLGGDASVSVDTSSDNTDTTDYSSDAASTGGGTASSQVTSSPTPPVDIPPCCDVCVPGQNTHLDTDAYFVEQHKNGYTYTRPAGDGSPNGCCEQCTDEEWEEIRNSP